MTNSLPPDVQATLEGLGVVTYDGIQRSGFGDYYQFTIRDPEFPECQPTFYVQSQYLFPNFFLAAYARTMREFAGEFTKQQDQ